MSSVVDCLRVLFDYQAFEVQRIGGVSRSYAELISHLDSMDECRCQLGLKESDNVYLEECGLSGGIKPLHHMHDLLFEGKIRLPGQRRITRRILGLFGYGNGGLNVNQEYCIKLLKRQSFTVFEPTYFDDYFLPYLKGKPFVMTVHDMIPELFPYYFARDNFQIRMKRLLCPLASHIHVPSNRTKEDLIRILNIHPERITVIPHGGPCPHEGQMAERLFDFPYLLFVGERFGYKNFQPWLKAMAGIVREHPEIHVVCTGKPFDQEEVQLIKDLHMERNVLHRFASKDDLGNLYHHAVAFVYPSEYEGFGLPILEAFAYGCPVMLNEASCFPEVGGDAAVYFSMKDGVSDFHEKFQSLYSWGVEDRNALIEKGKQRLQCFSWERSARELLGVYQRLL